MTVVNRTDRSAFLRVLNEVIDASLKSSEMVGLLLVSMRYFNRVYTSVGYAESGLAVSEIAMRLMHGLGNRATVLRVGSWKFAVVLRGIRSCDYGLLAARKVERLLELPVDLAGRKVNIEVVQGLALCPDHSSSAEELIQRAELALLGARESGQSFLIYDDSQADAARQLWKVQLALKNALADGGLDPHFQAQVDLASREFLGAEALLRCYSESGESLSPQTVVEHAEHTGQILQVTSVMLNSALRHASDWPASLVRRRVAVNVSAQNLKDFELVETIIRAVRTWNASPEDLAIEVTESALMDNPERAFCILQEIRALGVRVSIDDFGTGYSSLSYFKNIPAHELKVDRSFVQNMLSDAGSLRIVETVINLAHGFGLEVVAEGIEDEQTFELLREIGCDIAQGYWVGRPVPAKKFLEWLQQEYT